MYFKEPYAITTTPYASCSYITACQARLFMGMISFRKSLIIDVSNLKRKLVECRARNYGAPHYAILSILLIVVLLSVQIFSSTICSESS
jgi:hypothetical protein